MPVMGPHRFERVSPLCSFLVARGFDRQYSLYCTSENKARRDGRRQSNLEHYQELWDSGKTRAPIGDRHPDFRFTI
jgi:hypothetical protein